MAVAIASTTASAYVRSRQQETYAAQFWRDPRQVLEIAAPPSETGISSTDLMVAARTALASWSTPAISCTGVDLRVARATTDRQVIANDRRNRIIMRVEAWCRDPSDLLHCNWDPNAVAMTTIFSRGNGEIVDADIAINAAGPFHWALLPDGPITDKALLNSYDLTSAITHEAGHFIGLAHTCMSPGDDLLVDDTGTAYPSCAEIPTDRQSLIEDATMYPSINPADVSWRSLSNDDRRAACELYPTWSVPANEWIGGGGCAISARSVTLDARMLAPLIALFAASGWWTRRCSRRRRSR